ncbi:MULTISPECIES: MBL fold metallo-hydrolase [unclassified Frigoribacterium]|jgi:L-ascorbate metabolism protein UlaG (beta-lactamase superfamily)|uniref:MBL fold metallo-hydrolase n=1 Tax=unclassified Frigoribacterium TaxID=2627005 RepID=UPI0005BABBCB|nr:MULTISPECIES: MBL fold metallo-hydrolase [unclassified Frigoribacterium]KIU03666.1 beta-lactamase [Frigoribacterium sp. MEB024]MBD8538819.1 MBL fold metallo-hydrolase [Frigoribacterium sp. CFBP 8751]
MRLTKLEHACLILEKDGRKLVVDPGSFTAPLVDLHDVDAVVVTHEHADHWTPDQLTHLLATNPDATVYGPSGVATAAEGFDVHVVADGDTVEVGPFTLAFHGSRHAVIHESIPVIDNVGVLVDGSLFYPGDQFTVPPVPVDVLATPVGAPWLKVSEVIDYVAAVKPRLAFPTHEQTLSAPGLAMHFDRMKASAQSVGGDAVKLEAHESLDL